MQYSLGLSRIVLWLAVYSTVISILPLFEVREHYRSTDMTYTECKRHVHIGLYDMSHLYSEYITFFWFGKSMNNILYGNNDFYRIRRRMNPNTMQYRHYLLDQEKSNWERIYFYELFLHIRNLLIFLIFVLRYCTSTTLICLLADFFSCESLFIFGTSRNIVHATFSCCETIFLSVKLKTFFIHHARSHIIPFEGHWICIL